MESSASAAESAAEILIVEDSPTQAQQLRFMLEQNGFIVRYARNGVEALSLLATHRPLAVISDVNMPEMDGYELCRRIRSSPSLSALPIVLLTSLSDSEDVMLALECGADYFFTKPFNDELLVPRLRYIQDNRHLQRARPDVAPIAIRTAGGVHHIAAHQLQTLNLLLSTYESAVAQNRRLQLAETELRRLNESLEARVAERTVELVRANEALMEENAVRRQIEHRLREQAELLDKANEAIITVDLGNRITFWNRGAERLFGWAATEVDGRVLDQLLPLGGDLIGAPTGAASPTLDDWRGEVRCLNRAGDPLILETSVTVLRDAAGQPTGKFSISADITGKKKLEEQFLRAQRLESIGMLAAGIAHDLNNVLAPIGMAAALIRRRVTTPADLRLIDTMENSVARGAGLVRQILGFAHGIGGEPRVVQVKHLLHDITAVVAQTFPKSIELEEHVQAALWPVTGNATQIHQVLLNLCVNARDAMPNGGALRIRAENRVLEAKAAQDIPESRPGNWVVLQVEDTGTGIPPDVLARIWEPFFTTKTADMGTGLGLATVRGIVATHNGFIQLQTEPGRGTSFSVYLPAAESGTEAAVAATGESVALGRSELVLLVDNEESIRVTFREILEVSGYQVVTAADGVEAASLVLRQTADFALVITDYDMPFLDGDGLVRIIRTHRPATKILVMSGFASSGPGKLQVPLNLGDAHITKPCSIALLLKTVDELLHGNSGGRHGTTTHPEAPTESAGGEVT